VSHYQKSNHEKRSSSHAELQAQMDEDYKRHNALDAPELRRIQDGAAGELAEVTKAPPPSFFLFCESSIGIFFWLASCTRLL
jgi:hypothetical protein